MKLAQGQAELASCPHVSDEAKAALSEAAAPPMRAVTVGIGDTAFTVGEETVLFRHEKTFVNPCAIGVTVDARPPTTPRSTPRSPRPHAADFERVQQQLRCGFIAVRVGGDAARFARGRRARGGGERAAARAHDRGRRRDGAPRSRPSAASKPLICAATEANADAMFALAKQHAARSWCAPTGLEAVAALTEKAARPASRTSSSTARPATAGAALRDRVFARRSALVKKFAALGYPTITFPGDLAGGDALLETTYAAADVAKYGSIIVLVGRGAVADAAAARAAPEHLHRPAAPDAGRGQDLRDQQPGPGRAVLRHHQLLAHVLHRLLARSRAAKMPAYLGVVDAEGLSVLTAWAAGKFVPERIAKFVNDSRHRRARSRTARSSSPAPSRRSAASWPRSSTGWNVTVGPYEAADIPAFLKRRAG